MGKTIGISDLVLTRFISLNKFRIYLSAFGTDTKGDLIAELKLSHTIGGVSKLRNEQVL